MEDEFPLEHLLREVNSTTKEFRVDNSEIYNQLEEIKQILRGTEDIYGIEVVDTGSDFDITRIGEDVVQSDFNNIMPWAGMRRCTLADDGTVNSYYGDPTYVEDGSDGQVMVEIPKFYYRSYKLTNGFAWLVSETNKEGFEVFPAFVRDGIEKDYIYFSAYEGCAYDTSAGDYLYNDEQDIDWDNDLLSSIAGAQPLSGDSQSAHIENCRKIAQNRGSGWEQVDFLTVSAVQLLYLIEYADFNTQQTISKGITNLDSGDSNYAQNTGHTSELGNETGEVVISTLENGATGATETYAMSYRGIENFYGNIWVWVDGINIQDNVPYIADHGFDSDVFVDPYTTIREKLAENNGYQSNLAYKSGFDFGFLPIEVEGSSSTYVTDYYYQNTGNKVAALGGRWSDGFQAGGFLWALNVSSSFSSRDRSARLLYIP